MVTVATSIAPANIYLQQRAVASWTRAGLQVLSLNCGDEIARLRGDFPNVRFVKALRHGQELYGKPYVFLDEILQILRDSEAPICGIINSDIFVDSGPELSQLIVSRAQNALVAWSRTEIVSPDSREGPLCEWGYDAFFFPTEWSKIYPTSEFCLGLPSWDYWVPIVAILKGMPVKIASTPRFFHVTHECKWSSAGSKLARHLVANLLSKELRPLTQMQFGQALVGDLDEPYIHFLTSLFNIFIRCKADALDCQGLEEGKDIRHEYLQEKSQIFANLLFAIDILERDRRLQRKEMQLVRKSLSWRLTHPLRILSDFAKCWLGNWKNKNRGVNSGL